MRLINFTFKLLIITSTYSKTGFVININVILNINTINRHVPKFFAFTELKAQNPNPKQLMSDNIILDLKESIY